MTVRASKSAIAAGFCAALLSVSLGGCANETASQTMSSAPSYAGLATMGGARSEALHATAPDGADQFIEPTSSSKVISAIVFERVTGRTAYPDGSALGK